MSILVNRFPSEESIPVNQCHSLESIPVNRFRSEDSIPARLARRRRARSLDSTTSIAKPVKLSSSLRLFADEGVDADKRETQIAKLRRSTFNG